MKCFKRLLILLVFILSFVSVSYAQSLYLYEPAIMPLSIRTIGLGGSYIGVADDENVLFHNPAGLSLIDKVIIPIFSIGTVVGDTNGSVIRDQILGGNYLNIFNFALVLENLINFLPTAANMLTFLDSITPSKFRIQLMPSLNLGVIIRNFGIRLFNYASVDINFYYNGAIPEANVQIYNDGGIIVGASIDLAPFLFVGINFKYVLRTMIAKNAVSVTDFINIVNGDILTNIADYGYAKIGHGIGSDIGFILKLENVKFGLTVTDWWGGTKFNYHEASYDHPLEGDPDPLLEGVIPTALNLGASFYFEKLLLPRWIMSNIILAFDVKKLYLFEFSSTAPSTPANTVSILKNIYIGAEATFFDIDFIRNLFLLPLKIGVGFHQGNIAVAVTGKLLYCMELGMAIWGEERGVERGDDVIWNFAVIFNFVCNF